MRIFIYALSLSSSYYTLTNFPNSLNRPVFSTRDINGTHYYTFNTHKNCTNN